MDRSDSLTFSGMLGDNDDTDEPLARRQDKPAAISIAKHLGNDNGHTGTKRKQATQTRNARPASLINGVVKNETFTFEDTTYVKSPAAAPPYKSVRIHRPLLMSFDSESANLGSDDELMYQLRERGFNDRQISEELIRLDRAHYDSKSICTRLARIRDVKAAHVDWQLEEGLKEWTLKDDQNLVQACALADMEIEEAIECLRARRFRKVAEHMRHLDTSTMWSAKACGERYRALMEGTAQIPTDMDDDPEARRAKSAAEREERQRIRAAEAEEKQSIINNQMRIQDEEHARKAQKTEQNAARRLEKVTEKADRANQRVREATAKLEAQRNKAARKARYDGSA